MPPRPNPAPQPLPKKDRPLFGFRVEAEWKDLRKAKGQNLSWEELQRRPHLTNTTFFTTNGWNMSRAAWARSQRRPVQDRGLRVEADAHLRWDMAQPSPFISFFSSYERVLRFRDTLIMNKQAFNIVIIAVWLRDEDEVYDASALARYCGHTDLTNYRDEYLVYDSISVNQTIGAFGKLYPEVPPAVEGFVGADGRPVRRNPSPVRGRMDKGKVLLTTAAGRQVQIDFPMDYARDSNGAAWPAGDVTKRFMDGFCSPLVRDKKFLEMMRAVLVLRMARHEVFIQETANSWQLLTYDGRAKNWVPFGVPIAKR